MLEYKTMSMCASSDYCRGWNDAVKEMPRWISVKERMPEKSMLVLGVVRGHVGELAYIKDRNVFERREHPIEGVTHWMPLPPLPPCPEEYNKTIVFSKKKWMECQLPEDIREDALQSGWVDKCDGKPVKNGQCGQFLIVDTWCVDADEWEAYEDE